MSQSFTNLVNHETSQEAMDIANFLYNTIQGSPTLPYNSGAFGLVGDGVTDNTTNFQNAINSFGTQGGAIILAPGVYVTGPLTLASQVHIIGSGIESTIIQLKAGSNGDLFSANVSSINLSAAFGSSSTGGVHDFSIQNVTLDGNRANQTGGTSYPLRFYGYAFILNNLRIRNGFSGGVLIDWNGGTNSPDFNTENNLEAQITNVVIHDITNIGLEMGGPHDSQLANILVYDTSSHDFHLAPNAVAMLVSQMHCYSSTHGNNALSYLLEASSCCFVNCEAEGSDVVQVALIASGISWTGGRIFTSGIAASGIQIGQTAGNTPYPGEINQSGGFTTAVIVSGCNIRTAINNCEGTNGSLWFVNDSGTGNYIEADAFNVTGPYMSGTRSGATSLILYGRGLTADGTLGKSGGTILNGASLRNGTTGVSISSVNSSLGNGGTIITLNVGAALVNPSGAVTGIILQAGSFDGQSVWVVNESANTITFAIAGTSHVADGATSPIPASSARRFVYITATGLWYRSA